MSNHTDFQKAVILKLQDVRQNVVNGPLIAYSLGQQGNPYVQNVLDI